LPNSTNTKIFTVRPSAEVRQTDEKLNNKQQTPPAMYCFAFNFICKYCIWRL